MSGWDAYVDSIVNGSPAIRKAAIIGMDGSVWTRSEAPQQFAATEDELKKFAGHFNDLSSLPTIGADLENIHYIVPQVEDNLVFGRKDKTGFFAVKSKSAIVIAVYEGEASDGQAVRGVVEKVANYIEGAGY